MSSDKQSLAELLGLENESSQSPQIDGTPIAARVGINLSPAQSGAAIQEQGYSICYASAGTGKTTVLASRIAALIESVGLMDEGSVLACSFTKEATRHLKTTVTRMLGRPTQAMIMTLHSFCSLMVAELYWLVGYQSKPEPLSGSSKARRLRSTILTVTKFKALKDLPFSIDEIESWFQEMDVSVLGGLSAVEAVESIQFPKAEWKPLILGVYQEYHRNNLDDCMIDFDEMIFYGIEILRILKTEAMPATRRRLSIPCHVFIDEAQDMDAIQWILVEDLRFYAQSFVLIGDDDQSIYSWRGAMPDRFVGQLKLVDHSYVLGENRRSVPAIVHLAKEVLASIPEQRRVPKELSASRSEDGIIAVVVTPDYSKTLITAIESMRKEVLADKTSYADYAFIFRSGRGNQVFRKLQGILSAASIPFVVRGGTNVFDEPEAMFLRLIIGSILRQAVEVRSSWEEILEILGVTDTAAQKIILKAGEAENGVIATESLRKALDASRIKPATAEAALATIKCITHLRIRQQSNPHMKLNEVFSNETFKRLIAYIAGRRAEDEVKRKVKRGGVAEDEAETLRTELVRSHLEDFGLAMMALLETELSDVVSRMSTEESPSSMEDSNAVTITTAHSAKGLEWKTVYVMDSKASAWGARGKNFQGNHDERIAQLRMVEDEAIRLFYVAITRAKDRLFLLLDPRDLVTQADGEKRFEPSRPIDCLPLRVRKLTEELLRKFSWRQFHPQTEQVAVVKNEKKP